MSARVVYEPGQKAHVCVVLSGYRYHPLRGERPKSLPFDDPAFFAMPGTVIECDCGRTYVAETWRPGENFPRWRDEKRRERRRRERKDRKRD